MTTSRYPRERLAEAAADSRTFTEALTKLGIDPEGATRRYIRERMTRLGIDISHFEREGARWTEPVLREAVSASSNMNDVLRHLGLDRVGGNHTHISRRIAAMGIDTSHFTRRPTSGGHGRKRATEEILTVLPPGARRPKGYLLRAALVALGTPERCVACDTGSVWRGRPLALQVDHVNGDWHDNRLENLRLLCPNCHSVTANYRGRNKRRNKQ